MPVTPGTVIVTIPAGVATSINTGLPNQASTSTDNTVTWACIPELSIAGSTSDSPLLRGSLGRVASAGTIAYAQGILSMVVADMSGTPTIIGSFSNVEIVGLDVVVDGDFAYIAGGGLYIYDLSSPGVLGISSLRSTVIFGSGGTSQSIVKVGDLVYLTCPDASGIAIIDVSDPFNPTAVGTLAGDPNLSNAYGIVVDGNYAYVTDLFNKLNVIDISNPAAPTLVTAFTHANLLSPRRLAKSGNNIYIAADNSFGFQIFNVSTPASPTFVGRTASGTPQFCEDVVVAGTVAYVSSPFDDRVYSIDITTPSTPSVLGSVTDATTLNRVERIRKSGNYLYCAVPAVGEGTLTTVDVSTPASPVVADSLIGGNRLADIPSFDFYGSDVFAITYGGGLDDTASIVNASDPTNLSFGKLWWGNQMVTPGGIAVSGDHAYITENSTDQLTVFDISDPTAPLGVAVLADSGFDSLTQPVVDGNYLYVPGFDDLHVIDISTPTAPSVVGLAHSTSFGAARAAIKDGDLVYIACSNTNRLAIIDVSTPTAPTIVGSIQDATNLQGAQDLAKSGDVVWVAATAADRVTAVDVSTPSSPSVIGSIHDATLLDGVSGIVIVGDLAYVTAPTADSVVAIDISDPTSPTITDSITDGSILDGASALSTDGSLALYVLSKQSFVTGSLSRVEICG